jgi:hypothetical protein
MTVVGVANAQGSRWLSGGHDHLVLGLCQASRSLEPKRGYRQVISCRQLGRNLGHITTYLLGLTSRQQESPGAVVAKDEGAAYKLMRLPIILDVGWRCADQARIDAKINKALEVDPQALSDRDAPARVAGGPLARFEPLGPAGAAAGLLVAVALAGASRGGRGDRSIAVIDRTAGTRTVIHPHAAERAGKISAERSPATAISQARMRR